MIRSKLFFLLYLLPLVFSACAPVAAPMVEASVVEEV